LAGTRHQSGDNDMHIKSWHLQSLMGIAVTLSWAVSAQQLATPATSAAQAPAPSAAPASLSSSLGVIVFPAKSQTPTQQSSDEGACYTWAKTNTGIDPMAPVQPAAVQPTPDP